jgi:hypothetical protein
LEYPSFAIRLSNFIGTPIEMGLELLPHNCRRRLHRYAEKALWGALNTATVGLHQKRGRSSDRYYHLIGIASGAIGGFFGGPALLLELPFTTSVILRTIADIARSEGEDLEDIDTRLACLEVFALGGCSKDDDAAEAGYYSLRLALEATLSGASRYLAQNGLKAQAGAPILVDVIMALSQRFGVALSEKAAAEVVPIVGALGGAVINSLFIQHFQDMARSHFTLRRLERKYGPRMIRAEYGKLRPPAPKLLYAAAA